MIKLKSKQFSIVSYYAHFKYRVGHLLANLSWVDFDFESSTDCPILPGLMEIWQTWLGKWARRWNKEIQVNPSQGL